MDEVTWTLKELAHFLDWRARWVLEVLEQRGGQATQDVLLDETDFGQGQLYHVLSELHEVDLISRGAHGGGDAPVALTDDGRRALEEGLLEELGEGPPRPNAWRELYRRTKWLDGIVHR